MAYPSGSSMAALLAGPILPGYVTWIGTRPARKAALVERLDVLLKARCGLEGDHYETHHDGRRQATLIAIEDMVAIAAFLHLDEIAPGRFRRNMVTQGINLLALKGRKFRLGEAVLEGTGECAPCSRMEADLGPGAFNAMRGRGGITARILEGGCVRLDDAIVPLES